MNTSKALTRQQNITLTEVYDLDQQSFTYFKDKFTVQPLLNRALVSFQANKKRPMYRWYKFKEAFSASLVEFLFRKYGVSKGRILDPFAGSGTALFAASALGLDADGIELLPIGQQIIAAKRIVDTEFTPEDFERLYQWATLRIWERSNKRVSFPELRITRGAYPEETKDAIERYLGACQQENSKVRTVLRFALLSVLESISFTRKDGQYLRWDYRSGHSRGKKKFDKGKIMNFEQAVCKKINEILVDSSSAHQASLFPPEKHQGKIRLHHGSCLKVLPSLANNFYDAVMTSPPYCNRYDYTRTYALELALLGLDETGLSNLRQEMLSCTVENRAKDLLKINPRWADALTVADGQELLQVILAYLESQREQGKLNNNSIPRMVKGYFYEMACVIAELARVLKPNSLLFMVNDNVRYAGASISVDLILSDMAEKLGFYVESIIVLPDGKGNSSQQMGVYGREKLRKCIYVWRKR